MTKIKLNNKSGSELHPSLVEFLKKKKIRDPEDIEKFLFPSLVSLPDPFLFHGMEESVNLIITAINNKTDILIWGDYDVDGITGTCLLVRFFNQLGVKVRYHFPNRFKDGYGLNSQSIDELCKNRENEKSLLITVDCGISCEKEIVHAKSIGFDVIVTDHHEPGDIVVGADAIVNPKMQGCTFPDKNLSGVGVAFYLAAGVRNKLKECNYFTKESGEPNLKQFLDLVAIGTIADIVPLNGVNRILVRAGFEVLEKTNNPGMCELLASCDIRSGFPLTSEDIGFQIAPKINAAGRMGEGEIAANLLLSSNRKKAYDCAEELTRLNKLRRETTASNLETALTFEVERMAESESCIVDCGDYHLGVIGIVASQLVERYKVPAVLLVDTGDGSDNNSILKGSARSVPGLNLYECLYECRELLDHFGGHKMAAGLAIKKNKLHIFKDYFPKVVQNKRKNLSVIRNVDQSIKLPVEEVLRIDFINQFQLLEPFGEGNEKPIFVDIDPIICSSKAIGKDANHLKVTFRGKYKNHEGVGFGLGEKLYQLKTSDQNKIHFTPMLNRFNRATVWQVKIIDIR